MTYDDLKRDFYAFLDQNDGECQLLSGETLKLLERAYVAGRAHDVREAIDAAEAEAKFVTEMVGQGVLTEATDEEIHAGVDCSDPITPRMVYTMHRRHGVSPVFEQAINCVRTSDRSVALGFSSCRAAGEFEKAVLKVLEERKGS